MTTLQEEFAIIDAQHVERSQHLAEIKLLRILLKEARGGRISIQDMKEVSEAVHYNPQLRDCYGMNDPKCKASYLIRTREDTARKAERPSPVAT